MRENEETIFFPSKLAVYRKITFFRVYSIHSSSTLPLGFVKRGNQNSSRHEQHVSRSYITTDEHIQFSSLCRLCVAYISIVEGKVFPFACTFHLKGI